jgi:hypothetical protein
MHINYLSPGVMLNGNNIVRNIILLWWVKPGWRCKNVCRIVVWNPTGNRLLGNWKRMCKYNKNIHN